MEPVRVISTLGLEPRLVERIEAVDRRVAFRVLRRAERRAYRGGRPVWAGYNEPPEPWEPNITALHDPANLKWKDLSEPGIPLPTPWDKEEYEKHSRATQEKRHQLRAAGAPEEELEHLFREQQAFDTKFLAGMKFAGKVGAFEGARYEAKGLYRPAADCIMFTRDEVGFCPVCRRALERVIDQYSR